MKVRDFKTPGHELEGNLFGNWTIVMSSKNLTLKASISSLKKWWAFCCEKIIISFSAECVFFNRPLDQQVARHLLVMQYVTSFLIRYRVMFQSACISIGPEETCILPKNLSEKVTWIMWNDYPPQSFQNHFPSCFSHTHWSRHLPSRCVFPVFDLPVAPAIAMPCASKPKRRAGPRQWCRHWWRQCPIPHRSPFDQMTQWIIIHWLHHSAFKKTTCSSRNL